MASIGIALNRSLKSDFIALDIKAWIMSGGIAFALLVAFVIGLAVLPTPMADRPLRRSPWYSASYAW